MSGGLSRYIAGRLLRALLTVLGIVTLVFLLVRLTPGDPVDTLLGDQAAPEDRAALRAALHLDASLPRQYVGFVGDVVDGSLGESFRRRQVTVASLIVEVAAPTLWLALSALLVSWMIAIPVGCFAAARRGTSWDRNASTLAMIGLAVPTIVLGPLLILLFAVQLRWLPLPGDEEAGVVELILPAVTVGSALAAILMRQTRAAMIESLGQPYVLAARARGLSEGSVLLKHALRNAMLPVLTVGGAQLGALLSGLVVVERIFERRGLGSLLIDAALSLDYPVVQGCVLVIGTIYVLVNLLIDLLYGVVDPRVRLS
jgi:ABC-type dipeptide/oligopeptide/nickel transport system permease component